METNQVPHLFLGGTCGENQWREDIVIPGLVSRGVDPALIFNPVVDDWNEEAQAREDELKRTTRYMLYVIASPNPDGVSANVSAYSLVELIMSLYDAPRRTVALFDTTGMAPHAAKAIKKSMQDLRQRFPHAPIFSEYTALLDWLAGELS